MCGVIEAIAITSAALSIAGGVAQYQQAQQNTAYQNAAAQQQFQFQVLQAGAARSYEQNRQQQQDLLMQQNRFLADQAYADEVSQLNLRLQQEQAAAAQKQQEAAKAGLQARGEVVASGRVGNTIDNLIADYYRQQAAFDFATNQNLAFTGQQVQQQKRSAAATRGSRIASQQPYIMQPILDPIRPIAQPGPSALPYVIQGASGVVGAFSSGYSQAASRPGGKYFGMKVS